MNTLILLLCIC